MREIKQTAAFKRDLKRESKGQHRAFLAQNFVAVVQALANNELLAEKYRDHALTGDWKDYRDCHIRPDLILIYCTPDSSTLQLIRLGSHSELGL
jgi:mRNA interferase YafQ